MDNKNLTVLDSINKFIDSLSNHSILTREQERALTDLYKVDDTHENKELTGQALKARNDLITNNVRLVMNIANHYKNRGIAFDDLVSEGYIGLIKAADKFDPSKGNKFSTYATYWIRQAITRAISDQSRTIRIPVHLIEDMTIISKAYKQLLPDVAHITPELISKHTGISLKKVRILMQVMQEPISLQTPTTDNQLCIEDLISYTPDNTEIETKGNALDNLELALEKLPKRERDTLKLRLGIGTSANTLGEVAKILNITRERVRQIEIRALRMLRSNFIFNEASSEKRMS